jgi:rhamnose utilization protein RhaD (predicted bifunctional aldolase and dehydrogenase)
MESRIAQLIDLAHELGGEQRQLAILGEGNVSVKLSDSQFAVKASGCALGTLTERDVTICDTAQVLAMLDERGPLSDDLIEQRLLAARIDSGAKKPSLEAIFHAYLLSLPGVIFVAHCHPLSANQVLCSPRARDFAERRMFPDEIVYCGPRSVFVPYTDPGLPLAREIEERTGEFCETSSHPPRLILLQNHGIIGLGATMEAVLACTMMCNKAAAIFAGAAAMSGPNFLSTQQTERIATRRDEVHRQSALRAPPKP